MSQKKVDERKEYKKNREKILVKEKRKSKAAIVAVIVIAAAFLGWFSYSIYNSATRPAPGAEAEVETVDWNVTEYGDYLNSLKLTY